jgi:hypothetical protein
MAEEIGDVLAIIASIAVLPWTLGAPPIATSGQKATVTKGISADDALPV